MLTYPTSLQRYTQKQANQCFIFTIEKMKNKQFNVNKLWTEKVFYMSEYEGSKTFATTQDVLGWRNIKQHTLN